jgi:GNAT superfamily N-acetyltransferase
MLVPSVRRALFNGVVIEGEPCSGIAQSIAEVEVRGLPCGVQFRTDRHPDAEDEATALGLTVRTELPGMALIRGDLVDAMVGGLQIDRVEDEERLVEAARVTAAGFEVPMEMMSGLFAPELLGSGMTYYIGRVDSNPVAAAVRFQTGDDVGIFGVATPPAYRRRGYGAALSAHAVRCGFEAGAEMTWLQTSPMAESIYRTLGFQRVVLHAMLTRPTS